MLHLGGEVMDKRQRGKRIGKGGYTHMIFSHKQKSAKNINSQKYFIFSTQVGKAWNFIFKPKKIRNTN
jgi:hypothetical protein